MRWQAAPVAGLRPVSLATPPQAGPRSAGSLDLAIGECIDGPSFHRADGQPLGRHGASRLVRRNAPGSPSRSVRARCGTRSSPPPSMLAPRSATSRRSLAFRPAHHDALRPRRASLDRHATYIVAAYFAGSAARSHHPTDRTTSRAAPIEARDPSIGATPWLASGGVYGFVWRMITSARGRMTPIEKEIMMTQPRCQLARLTNAIYHQVVQQPREESPVAVSREAEAWSWPPTRLRFLLRPTSQRRSAQPGKGTCLVTDDRMGSARK